MSYKTDKFKTQEITSNSDFSFQIWHYIPSECKTIKGSGFAFSQSYIIFYVQELNSRLNLPRCKTKSFIRSSSNYLRTSAIFALNK